MQPVPGLTEIARPTACQMGCPRRRARSGSRSGNARP